MSLYQNASKFVSSGSDIFLKLQSGKKTRIRIIDHPYVSTKQFKPGGDVATRFAWPVWDYESGRVRVLEKGPSVFSAIADITAEYGEEVPMECDIVITMTGEGMQTRYSLVPGKVQKELPKELHEQLPVMSDVIKNGIPLKDFSEGKKPKMQTPDDSEYTPDEVPIDAYEG